MFSPFPCTAKQLLAATNQNVALGASLATGYRSSNQDVVLGLTEVPNHPSVSVCGIFDGHGERDCVALHCAYRLPEILGQLGEICPATISKACAKLDREIGECWYREQGSTGVFLLVTNGSEPGRYKAYVCNVGDSRCIAQSLGQAGASNEPPPLRLVTQDHTPGDPDEERRIVEAGGFVTGRRVCGDLAVSRSFGDWKYKTEPIEDSIVCSVPDILAVGEAQAGDLFILASDGLFERVSTERVCDLVQSELPRVSRNLQYGKLALMDTSRLLCDEGLQEGSRDNISVCIAALGPTEQKSKIERCLSPGVCFEDIERPASCTRNEAAYKKSLSQMLDSIGVPPDKDAGSRVIKRRTHRPVTKDVLAEVLEEQRQQPLVRIPPQRLGTVPAILPNSPMPPKELPENGIVFEEGAKDDGW